MVQRSRNYSHYKVPSFVTTELGKKRTHLDFVS